MPAKVETVAVRDGGMNCYLVENTDTREVLVVDPGAEAERIIAAIGARKLVAVLLTHAHYDHIGAVDALCERYDVPLYMHEGDLPKLTDTDANVGALFGFAVTVHAKPLFVTDQQTLKLAHLKVTVLYTPGHSKGSVCYLLPDGAGILTGDTLFDHGYGRTDFPDGSFPALAQSLRRLMRLSPRMPAYPGHGSSTMVGKDEA